MNTISHSALRTPHSAFTLIEFIIVIVILSLISIVGSQLLVQGFRANFTSREITTSDWQARVALERLSRELEGIRSNRSIDLVISPTSQITFTDLNGNVVIYTLSGTQLTRQENAGTAQVLSDSVSSLTFSYHDQNVASTASVTSVRTITVDFTITQGDVVKNYTMTVYPRNFI
ncbi:MAG: prepilin-type N-terminal cleavage/methylation domain-containing protein [Gammaproteobacteria bacterium]|nr:prepilin-type N-terminal cleavage/methylation domain-containing protein [Gammaproteobacteria bacterium]